MLRKCDELSQRLSFVWVWIRGLFVSLLCASGSWQIIEENRDISPIASWNFPYNSMATFLFDHPVVNLSHHCLICKNRFSVTKGRKHLPPGPASVVPWVDIIPPVFYRFECHTCNYQTTLPHKEQLEQFGSQRYCTKCNSFFSETEGCTNHHCELYRRREIAR